MSGTKRAVRSVGPKPKQGWRTAKNSDRHDLYELSVQDPAMEVDFIHQVWREIRKKKCAVIREDFCGTAALSVTWVKAGPKHEAWAIDLDQKVLEWGAARHVSTLTPEQAKRLHVVRGDVRTAHSPKVDTVLAMNFSYYVFKTRPDLLTYFKAVRKNLKPDGIFILDAYGGSDSWLELEEERNLDGFTYVWDQRMVNPITHEVLNHIHFRFPDGSEMTKAFTYDWRLWTVAELREVLTEAGFGSVTVYWEGTNHKTGEGNGIFKPTMRGEACQGWIAYLAAAV
jgi:SAM-dependent methyltransferase